MGVWFVLAVGRYNPKYTDEINQDRTGNALARNKQTTISDEVFDLLKLTPIWVGPILAFGAFAVVRWVLPTLIQKPQNGPDVAMLLRQSMPMLSWFAAVIVLMAWVAAEFHKLKTRHLFNRQTDIDSVRSLSWSQFEHLIGEYYRRRGYLAEVVGSAGGDGGVDVVLNGHGERVLVQCKQWKAYKVPVQPVRELLGVVTAQKASRGILVTSGRATTEARRFAEENRSLELVEGGRLMEMIQSIQQRPRGGQKADATGSSPRPLTAQSAPAPTCPSCGDQMIARTAKKGQNAGSRFWGCQRYPACRGTRSY